MTWPRAAALSILAWVGGSVACAYLEKTSVALTLIVFALSVVGFAVPIWMAYFRS